MVTECTADDVRKEYLTLLDAMRAKAAQTGGLTQQVDTDSWELLVTRAETAKALFLKVQGKYAHG